MANWLYSRPVSPGMNATGTNTAASTRVMVKIGAVISAIAARTAGIGCSPRSRYFSTFSTTMMASSTTRPMARIEPAKRQRVDREAEGGHHREGRHQGDRYRHHGNDRRPHALKENEDDQQHEQERFEQGLFDLADVLAHILGRVVGDAVLEAGGKFLASRSMFSRTWRRCRVRWRRHTDRSAACRPACRSTSRRCRSSPSRARCGRRPPGGRSSRHCGA